MSDFQKAMRQQSGQPWVKKAEAGEQAEGIRDAIKAGRGDVVKGAKALKMEKPGLKAQLKKQQMKCGRGK